MTVVVAAGFIGLAPPSSGATLATYRVDDLGALAGDSGSVARGINVSGQVVGWSNGPTGTRAFVYTDGIGMRLLPAPAGRPHSVARAINNAGTVVGTATTGGTDLGHAVRWTNGVPRDIGTLGSGPYSEGYGINTAGTAVGYSYIDGAVLDGTHAFVQTDPAAMVDVTPGGSAEGQGVNSVGQVTGWKNGRAFRWHAGTFTDLGVPVGLAMSFGFAINDGGQVAGSAISASGNTERPFRYTDGIGSVVLGGVGEHNTAFGINSRGDVVGTGRAVAGPIRAFIYTDSGGMADLNALIDPASGWVVMGASSINDAGQIAAYGFSNLTGQSHALRLSPTGSVSSPAAPTGLSATGTSSSSIRLSWTDRATNETGYRVERRTGTNAFAQVTWTGADATSFVDNTLLVPGTTYDYRVYAFNVAGSSTYSNIASAQTVPADITAPTVTFISPVAGVAVSGRVRVQVTARDNLAVSSVRLLVDGVTTCQAAVSPLTCTWNTRKALGAHTLRALAADPSGNQGSTAITVTVVR
jgi:probable HAF family extracellular repeat protein